MPAGFTIGVAAGEVSGSGGVGPCHRISFWVPPPPRLAGLQPRPRLRPSPPLLGQQCPAIGAVSPTRASRRTKARRDSPAGLDPPDQSHATHARSSDDSPIQLHREFLLIVRPVYSVRNRPRRCSFRHDHATEFLEHDRREQVGMRTKPSPPRLEDLLHVVGDGRAWVKPITMLRGRPRCLGEA